jgi:hypothetical protein
MTLTLLDAWWALRRNNLTTSPQELRFQSGMKDLLGELKKLSQFQGTRENIEKKFDDFAVFLVGVAARTFSAKAQVDAGLMIKNAVTNMLELKKWSRGAQYDETLEIPIPTGEEFSDSGPAALSFKRLQLVYLPRKDRDRPKKAWPFQLVSKAASVPEFDYVTSLTHRCWKKALTSDKEDFYSVICVPIEDFGVLNFSTKMRDPFIDRDFFMAESYASILGHAAMITRDKIPSRS